MRVLSHRGFWRTTDEKNSSEAFARSFSSGFGTETDFRDKNGQLIISHDPPGQTAMSAESFFELYGHYTHELPIAINIKADGLQKLLSAALDKYKVRNYFVFDMSIPDMLGYLRAGLNVFTRQSEHERTPALYEQARGVWIDCFESEWADQATIAGHLYAGKQVCVVSPELHGRPHEIFWERLRKMTSMNDSDLMICTDYPDEARRFFQ